MGQRKIELKEAMSRSQLTAYTGAMVDRLAYKAHILDLSRDVSHRYEETVKWQKEKN